MPGTLFVVATPIGNLDDLTGRALRVLRDAAVIAAEDTRRTARLLSHYGIATPTTSLHEHNEDRKSASLVFRLERGDDVALVSDAGTPGISDPGRRFVRAALDAGITVSPVPGPSAVAAAISASGFSADSFTFLGFPPVRSRDRKKWLESLRRAGRTVVFFEAPHRILATLESVREFVGETQVLLARELTKIHETLVVGPISSVIDRLGEPIGEYTVVVEIGQITDTVAIAPPPDAAIADELGRMTINKAGSRRRILTQIARKYSLTPNEVYSAVERAKKSAK